MKSLTEISGSMEESQVRQLAVELGKILKKSHKTGRIHGNISPQTIQTDEEGHYDLIKWGESDVSTENNGFQFSMQTKDNYQSPDMYLEESWEVTDDLYSLGLVLYSFMNGNRLPFYPPEPAIIKFTDRKNALRDRMAGIVFPKPKNASESFAEIIMKLCEYQKEDRYQSADELLSALGAGADAEEEAELRRIELEAKKAAEEAELQRKEVERQRKEAEAKKAAEEAERQRKEAEAKKAAEEAERQRKEVEAKKAAEEAEHQRKEAEAKRAAEKAKRQREEAEAKKAAEEAERQRKEAEAKKVAEEAERQRKEAEAKKAAEEAERQREEAEAEEADIVELMRQQKELELALQKAIEEKKKKKEEAAKKAAEEAAKKAAEEAAKKAAEEAAKKAAEKAKKIAELKRQIEKSQLALQAVLQEDSLETDEEEPLTDLESESLQDLMPSEGKKSKAETLKVEQPKAERPKVESSRVELSKEEQPETEMSKEASSKDVPKRDIQEKRTIMPFMLMLVLWSIPLIQFCLETYFMNPSIKLTAGILLFVVGFGIIVYFISFKKVNIYTYKYSDLLVLLCVCGLIPYAVSEIETRILLQYGEYLVLGNIFLNYDVSEMVQLSSLWIMLGIVLLGIGRVGKWKPKKSHKIILGIILAVHSLAIFIFTQHIFFALYSQEFSWIMLQLGKLDMLFTGVWVLVVILCFWWLGCGKISTLKAVVSLAMMYIGEIILMIVTVLLYNGEFMIGFFSFSLIGIGKAIAPLVGLLILCAGKRKKEKAA